MKKRNIQTSNGISISDSIVMSVRQKKSNPRKLFSALITLIGFVSVLMAFLGMFRFNFTSSTVVFWGFIIIAFYISLSVIGGKALYIYTASVFVFFFAVYKKLSVIINGCKFMYNVIYKASFETKVNYFKNLRYAVEVPTVTTLIIFYMWLLAIILCFFTICRPNPILPLYATFPLLELGMYNGVKMSVFWGMLCISYWLALLAMSTIDVGEYSGGQSGFVRKKDLFFPKRQMKLKVTEKCGIFIICAVMLISLMTMAFMRLTHYKRSDEINQKRVDITEAMENFSFDDLSGSIDRLCAALGINIETKDYKLGNNSHIKYKNVTDLNVTIDDPNVDRPIYLKGYAGAVYNDNEWFDLPESAYKSEQYAALDKYELHAQDILPAVFTTLNTSEPNRICIKTVSSKNKHTYAPYCVLDSDDIIYTDDTLIRQDSQKEGETTYNFISDSFPDTIDSYSLQSPNQSMFLLDLNDIADPSFRQKIKEYCSENNMFISDLLDNASGESNIFVNGVSDPDPLYSIIIDSQDNIIFDPYNESASDIAVFKSRYNYSSNPELKNIAPQKLLTLLMTEKYDRFAQENYLEVPDTKEMQEVREEFSDILDNSSSDSPVDQLETLEALRDKMTEMCCYTLQPGFTPKGKDYVNHFLLESHRGYCSHFATAGVILARMAGIPARFATGYVIPESDINSGKHNSDGSLSINVKDNRKHAWAEVYLTDTGWIPFEFTEVYSASRISETTTSTTDENVTTTVTTLEATTTANETSTSEVTATVTSIVSPSNAVTSTNYLGRTVKPFRIPQYVKYIFMSLVIIALLMCALLLRRRFILKSRRKKLSAKDTSERIRNIYVYAERLLSEKKLECKYGSFVDFSSVVEKEIGGIYFDEGGFEEMMRIALKTSFGNYVPTQSETEQSLKIVNQLAASIYHKSDRLQKFKLKYISVLI